MNYKRFFSFILTICLVMSLFAGFVQTASADDNIITHTVQNGEYLFKICKAYGLDYYQCKNAIMALNGFTSEQQMNRISVGQQIKLPASNALASTVKSTTTTTVSTSTTVGSTTTTTSTTTTAAGTPAVASTSAAFFLVPYTVQSGDTLNSICNALGTSYFNYQQMILAMNGIANAGSLQVGKKIYIPVNAIPATGGTYYTVNSHTVKNGETVTGICSAYGINYGTNSTLINGLNSGKNLNSIYVGQSIYVPSVATAAPATTASTATTTTSTSSASSSTAAATAAVPQFDITFDYNTYSPWKGNPYAMVNGKNVSKAAAGQTVVINGNANTSYALQSIEVTRADSTTKTTYTGNSFIMPACGVRIVCNYVKAYAVIKTPTANGSFTVLVNGVEADYALKDDTIKLVPTPNAGFSVGAVKVNGTAIAPDSNGEYTFKMPAADTTVEITFIEPTYWLLQWNSTVYNGLFYVQVNGLNVPNGTKATAGQTVTVICSPNSGYQPSVSVVAPAGVTVKQDGNNFTFTMPGDDTILDVKFDNHIIYKISANSLTDSSWGKLRFSVAGKIQTVALAGQTVTIEPEAVGAHEFDYAFVRFADLSASVSMIGPLSFVMPAADVVVYGQFKAGAVQYTVSQHAESGCGFKVYDDSGTQKLSFSAGETVHLVPLHNTEKYKVSAVKWVDSSGTWYTATFTGSDYTFTMPASNVQVKAELYTYENWVTVQLADITDGGGNVIVKLTATVNGNNVSSGQQVVHGSKIILTATPYGDATFTGFAENGVNDLVGIDQYNCYYIVGGTDASTVNFWMY